MIAAAAPVRADAAVTGKPAAMLCAKTRGTLKVLEKQLTIEECGCEIRRDLPDLVRMFSVAVTTRA